MRLGHWGRYNSRTMTVLLAFAFAFQSFVSIPAATAGQLPAMAPRPHGSVAAETPLADDLPLMEPSAPLAAVDNGGSGATPDDPKVDRGDIRPPQPEAAGTVVDAGTNRRTTTVSKGDGAYETTTSGDAVNYQDAQGHWHPIDLSLVAAGADSEFARQTKANDRVVELAAGVQGHLARLAGGADELLIGSPDLTGTAAAIVHGPATRFGASATTIEFTPTVEGLYFSATLASATGAPAVRLTLETDDQVATVLSGGTIVFRDAGGTRMPFLIGPPTLVDAKGRQSTDVSVALGKETQDGTHRRVILTYSVTLKVAASLAYPLTFDPAIILWPTSTTQSIKVVDGTGSAVGSVSLTLPTGCPNGTFDSQGVCANSIITNSGGDAATIYKVNPDAAVQLTLSKSGYFTKAVTLTPTPGATMNVTLWPTSTTQPIKVVDGTGSAVGSVSLTLPTGCPNGSFNQTVPTCLTSGTTDSGGLKTIYQVNPDAAVQLTLTKSGYFTKTVSLTPTPGTTITITLWPTSTTQPVKVVDGTGSAVGSVSLTLPTGCPNGSFTSSGCSTSGTTDGGSSSWSTDRLGLEKVRAVPPVDSSEAA